MDVPLRKIHVSASHSTARHATNPPGKSNEFPKLQSHHLKWVSSPTISSNSRIRLRPTAEPRRRPNPAAGPNRAGARLRRRGGCGTSPGLAPGSGAGPHRCRSSSVVERTLGKGEVGSSILPCGTIGGRRGRRLAIRYGSVHFRRRNGPAAPSRSLGRRNPCRNPAPDADRRRRLDLAPTRPPAQRINRDIRVPSAARRRCRAGRCRAGAGAPAARRPGTSRG